MATYKKRGYKPSSKEEEQNSAEQESTTAEVFNSLDDGANKTEAWVAKHQNFIFIILGIAVVGVLGYLGWKEYIQEPKEIDAANEMAQAQHYFNSALQASAAQEDSLYNLALTGGEGKFGFIDITENYGGTEAANLAHYYAGIAFLNTQQYQKAIDQLEDFESEDQILAPIAKGAIADAFMQLNQPKDALSYYVEAANLKDNPFTTPKFLMKAATLAIELGDGQKAEEFLKRIEDEYPQSAQAANVDIYLGQAQAIQE